ncbi:hypothetical protein LR48_Vigan04g100400 [Vigna angularis]|uniref:Uncharacterized protein n=1 Tax=Phaseolus angularis TaxID=3914 RepID=A0A0L9UDL3_PHAAN|nr:hypothetical protein LR48_Vigan04g100400 [Vigna angularis]
MVRRSQEGSGKLRPRERDSHTTSSKTHTPPLFLSAQHMHSGRGTSVKATVAGKHGNFKIQIPTKKDLILSLDRNHPLQIQFWGGEGEEGEVLVEEGVHGAIVDGERGDGLTTIYLIGEVGEGEVVIEGGEVRPFNMLFEEDILFG